MRSGVADTIFNVPVRQIIAQARGIEGKFENLHARQATVGEHFMHLRRERAKILGNEADVVKPRGEPADKIHARSRPPLPFLCAFGIARHGPIAFKCAEVIYAQHVIQL